MAEMSSITDQSHFREVLSHFASGLTIVTSSDEQGPVGFTCQSFASLSLDPPLVVFAPSKTSMSWPRIKATSRCAINVLASTQEVLARAFAESGSDKFAGVGYSLSSTNTPLLDGALAWIECELVEVYDAGDHELVTARVVQLGVGSGEPLLFYRGGFGDLRV